jgi:nicotinamide mononucleotide transporter PnuC
MKLKIKTTPKKLFLDYIPMAMTAILIITFAIINKQTFFKTLPTIITLFVQILLSRANRFGFLLGGINATLYGLAVLGDGLYFSVVSSICISAPIQIYSFFNWSKKQTSQNHTELKRFTFKHWVISIGLTLVGWAICYYGLAGFFADALLPAFDTFCFAIGLIVSVYAAFRYIESQYLSMISCAASIVMWIIICISMPNNTNYLIISFYNFFMVAKAAINWTKQYNNDQKTKGDTEK